MWATGLDVSSFHSKMNALGEDIVSFLLKSLRPGSDAVRNFDGFVISTDAANFSVGANLMQLLLAVQDGEWDEIELTVKQFQNMTQAVKFCPRAGGGSTRGHVLGGWDGDLHACGGAAGTPGTLHGAGGDRRRFDSRRWRV